MSCLVSFMLTLTWGIDIFEKLKPEIGGCNLKGGLWCVEDVSS